ncbi:octanoyltransferase LipM [Rubritalea halochordaticola]|uniref:Octanoyltransferase LipM n=1 Tax=Rubritalea halochordaticola TaxID=714537 RepID=A0ABP9V633_9BACT
MGEAMGVSIFSTLRVWHDPVARTGPENMAVDQLLLEGVSEAPVLRFYAWCRPEVSFGYFESLAEARESFEGDDLEYVRRWTGGGIVDHRVDITYTLVVPREHAVAQMRGAGSYEVIHQAVAEALVLNGVSCKVIQVNEGGGESACFVNPVAFDITDSQGNKLAGAGQKRTRYGLLHQGSVQGVREPESWKEALVLALCDHAESWQPAEELLAKAREVASQRYAQQDWLEKRP